MHAGADAIRALTAKAGITITKERDFYCEDCLDNRLHDHHGSPVDPKYTAPGQMIRFDLIYFKKGFMGYQYCLHFIDMATNQHWVRFTATKKAAFEEIKLFTAFFEHQAQRPLQAFGTDGGPEFGLATTLFKDSQLVKWARKRGTAIHLTLPHSPWMNGKAEKAGFDLVGKAKTSHNAAGLPHYLWPFTMQAACTVLNLLPSRANKDFKSPCQAMADALNLPSEAVPTGDFLRIIGSDVWIHVKKEYRQKRDKYAKTGLKTRLLAWDSDNGKIVWCWDPVTDTIHRAVAIKVVECENPRFDGDQAACEYVAEFSDTSVEEEVIRIITAVEPPRPTVSSSMEGQPEYTIEEDSYLLPQENGHDFEEPCNHPNTTLPSPNHTPERILDSITFQPLDGEGGAPPVDDVPQGVSSAEVLAEEEVIPPERRRQPPRRATAEKTRTAYLESVRYPGGRPTKIAVASASLHEGPLESLCLSATKARHNVLNKNNSARTRHIDIRYKWIIQRTQHGDFHIKHIETDKMAADGLTKPLEATKFEIFKQLLGLVRRSIFQGG